MPGIIGDILPYAVVIAISPIPIIAAILLLMSPRARGTSVGFLFGWVAGVVLAVSVFSVVGRFLPTGGSDEPHPVQAVIQAVLGALLIVLAVRKWRSRPAPGEVAALPKWMSAIDAIEPGKSFGFGFVFSALNPKNLILSAAAGIAIGSDALQISEIVLVIVIYVAIATASVTIPIVAYLVAGDRMRAPLESLRVWLVRENATVMAVVLLVIGVTVLGKGIGGF